jgi:hypothetical protein
MVDGEIDPAQIKIYQCAVWVEGDTHGGDISATEIVSGADQNIFDDVTNAERIAGDTEYRKIFIKNLNAATWNLVKGWIDTFTPAANDEISIKLGTNEGVQSAEGMAPGYVSPDSKVHADVLNIGDLAQDAYQAIWIKRSVTAGGSGYTGNNFKLIYESS